MKNKNTGISIDFNFNNPIEEKQETYYYEINDDEFIDVIKHLAEINGCSIAGSSNHIWNFLNDIYVLTNSILGKLEDNESFISAIKNMNNVKYNAWEEFREELLYKYEDEIDESKLDEIRYMDNPYED